MLWPCVSADFFQKPTKDAFFVFARFRLKCTPADPQHIEEVMKLLQQHFHGNPQEEGGGHSKEEDDDEDEL